MVAEVRKEDSEAGSMEHPGWEENAPVPSTGVVAVDQDDDGATGLSRGRVPASDRQATAAGRERDLAEVGEPIGSGVRPVGIDVRRS